MISRSLFLFKCLFITFFLGFPTARASNFQKVLLEHESKFLTKYQELLKQAKKVFHYTDKEFKKISYEEEILIENYFRTYALSEIKGSLLDNLAKNGLAFEDIYLDSFIGPKLVVKGFKQNSNWYYFDEDNLSLENTAMVLTKHLNGSAPVVNTSEEADYYGKNRVHFTKKNYKNFLDCFMSYPFLARVYRTYIEQRGRNFTSEGDRKKATRQSYEEIFYRVAHSSKILGGKLKSVAFKLKANTITGQRVIFKELCIGSCEDLGGLTLSYSNAVDYIINETL